MLTKAKEDPSPYEMRLPPTGHQPSISWSRIKLLSLLLKLLKLLLKLLKLLKVILLLLLLLLLIPSVLLYGNLVST